MKNRKLRELFREYDSSHDISLVLWEEPNLWGEAGWYNDAVPIGKQIERYPFNEGTEYHGFEPEQTLESAQEMLLETGIVLTEKNGKYLWRRVTNTWRAAKLLQTASHPKPYE